MTASKGILSSLCIVGMFVTSVQGESQTMQVTVDTSVAASLQITPVDAAHTAQLPADVLAVVASLPSGSYVVVNKRTVPMNAMVTNWQYVDHEGRIRARQFACDGYPLVPVKAVVSAGGWALMYPTGCVTGESLSTTKGSGLSVVAT